MNLVEISKLCAIKDKYNIKTDTRKINLLQIRHKLQIEYLGQRDKYAEKRHTEKLELLS